MEWPTTDMTWHPACVRPYGACLKSLMSQGMRAPGTHMDQLPLGRMRACAHARKACVR